MKLHVIQAEYGDCFILESKYGKYSANVLIDGGPNQTYEKHLKPALQKLLLNGKLDLMVLSHIDNDHIIGLLDLLEDIKNQRENGTKELVNIEKIWHNSFMDLLQFHEQPIKLLRELPLKNNIENKEITASLVMKGFQQGLDLTKFAKLLKIPINPEFGKLIVINDKIKSVNLNDITLRVLGPLKKNVDKLQKEWKKWTRKKTSATIAEIVQILDKSVPNLASITFLVELEERKILFTGDGLGQDILEILSKNTMLDSSGKFYVDILKVPHHGSDRNITQEFFNKVIAEYYVVSANGRDDNPSFDTLKWIIESTHPHNIVKKIIFTNMTTNVKRMLQKYDSNKFKYESMILKKDSDYVTITL